MRITLKRVFSFFCVICLVFVVFCTEGVFLKPSAEVVWEKNYYKTQTQFYAGGETNSISTTDNTFSDWDGREKVRISSAEHPENWQESDYKEDFVYSYSLAWNRTYLYYYLEVETAMSLILNFSPRFYYDVSPLTTSYTGSVEFSYDPATDSMAITRVKNGSNYDEAFRLAIKFHCAEINGDTYLEAAIPWSSMYETFSFDTQPYIRYNTFVGTTTSVSNLFPQDTSVWTSTTKPWSKSTHYLTMYFSEGEPTLQPITPTPLTTSSILNSSYQAVNCALGKAYTGTVGTVPDWNGYNETKLTEGSFQTIDSINGAYMEGFSAEDVEEDGTIIKKIDLGAVESGLYKFEVGVAQVVSAGILFPSSVKVYASANDIHYQYLGEGVVTNYENTSEGTLKEIQRATILLAEGVEARYIKFKITPPEDSYDFIALSEMTVIHNISIDEEEEIDPILSLGAKVNKESKGLRFGAKFSKIELKEVEQIGMLLYPTAKLGGAVLDMEYYLSNPYSAENQSGVILINAVAISKSDYIQGKTFGNYSSFTFFISILGIPEAQLATNITSVPFVEYTDGSILYGTPLIRNYSAVSAATDAVQE